jgi:H+/Cl- antiporter ClcA
MVSVLQVVVALGVVLVAAAPWLPFLSDHLYTWLDRSLVPWLHRERWAWPVIVLLVLIPPATTIFGWLRGRAAGSGHPIPGGARDVTAGEQLQVAYPDEPALPAQDKAIASRSVVAT